MFLCNIGAARHRNSKRTGDDRVPEDILVGQIARMERPTKGEGFDDILVAS